MRVKNIGTRTTMPKSGKSQDQQASPQWQANARGREETQELKVPPAQGLGKFVDKSV